MSYKSIAILGCILVIFFVAWVLFGYFAVRNIETPKYTSIKDYGKFEVRQYDQQILAEVLIGGSYGQALNDGFRLIADYIFGNNLKQDSSEPIAMTAPVLQSNEQDSKEKSEAIAMTAPVLQTDRLEKDDTSNAKYKVAFVMPSRYKKISDLPIPNNPKVNLVEIPAKQLAVLGFSGYATEVKVAKLKKTLLEEVENSGLKIQGLPTLAQYNPPFTPPFMRKNEIWVEVIN